MVTKFVNSVQSTNLTLPHDRATIVFSSHNPEEPSTTHPKKTAYGEDGIDGSIHEPPHNQ